MKRNDFIKSAAGACLACAGGSFMGGQEPKLQADKSEQERRAREFEKRFKEEYVRTLMENMEKRLDEKTRVELMNECGRACARRGGLYKMALDSRGDIKKFVQTSAERLGKDNVFFQDETTVHWSYPRCYCELVAEGPARLPDTYCHCSVGWVLEMFETVLKKPVKVDLIQSIKRGGSSCVFKVRL
jgi:hypothetical protein